MARGINKAILIGNLGNDPDIRYTASGTAIANISLATAESWRDKNSGEQQERTEWHRIVFFGRLAEVVGEYLRKGSQIYVEGRIQTRKWQDKEGNDRYSTEVVANEMQMLGGRGGAGAGAPMNTDLPGQTGSQARAPAARNTAPPPDLSAQAGKPAARPGAAPADDFDDDIPF